MAQEELAFPGDVVEQNDSFPGEDLHQSDPTDVSNTDTESLADFYSFALEKDIDEVKENFDIGNFGLLYDEAQRKASALRDQKIVADLDQKVQEATVTPEDITEFSMEFGNQDYFIAPDVATMLATSPRGDATAKRYTERSIALGRMIEDKRNSTAAEGTAETVGYFADFVAGWLYRDIEGTVRQLAGSEGSAANELVELAQELNYLLIAPNVTSEEFEAQVGSILDRVSDASYFTEDNPFIIEDFLAYVAEGGEGKMSQMGVAAQALDVLTLGLPAITKMSKAGYRAGLISAASSVEDGTKVVTNAATKTAAGTASRTTEDMANIGTTPAALRTNTEVEAGIITPEQRAMFEVEKENALLAKLKEENYGSLVPEEVIEAHKMELLADMRAGLVNVEERRIISYDVQPHELSNYKGIIEVGQRGGTPWKTEAGAIKEAKKYGLTEDNVIPVVEGGETRYIIRVEDNISVADLIEPTNLDEVSSGFFSKWFSTTARTDKKLDAILKQGEGISNKVRRDLRIIYNKAWKRANSKEKRNVDSIFKDLRDDPEFSVRKSPYTEAEFKDIYEKKFRKPPSKAEVDLYKTMRDAFDVDYRIQADAMLQQAVADRQKMRQFGGVWYRTREVQPGNVKGTIYDPFTWKPVNPDDMAKGEKIIEVKDFINGPNQSKARYVVDNGTVPTRMMYARDVMPYNAGGHRWYNGVYKFYIKQPNMVKLIDNATVRGADRTVMAVRTEAEANQAITQINNILRASRDGLSEADMTTVIRANNDWHNGLETVDDWNKFVKDFKVDVSEDFSKVSDGESMLTDSDSFYSSLKEGDKFSEDFVRAIHRTDRPLLGFGGGELSTIDPSKTIARGFSTALFRRSELNYNFNAVHAWAKAARQAGYVAADDPRGARALFNDDELLKAPKNEKLAKKLEAERATIRFRLSSTTDQVVKETKLMRELADAAFDRNQKRLGQAIDWMSQSDPAGFLRGLAFHSKLGLFAVDQLMVQASQLINVWGIASGSIGPLAASRGMMAVAPLRMALLDFMPDAVRKHIAHIQAPFTGIHADDFLMLTDWIKSTGRNIIDGSIIEENRAAGFLGPSKVLDWGQAFFREGEVMARLGAAAVNLKEIRKAGYLGDINATKITRQMIGRQDILSASMTSASAAPWQKSLWAIPLQFTTYNLRMIEQIFTGSVLKGTERASLGATHVMFYGLAGIPAAGYVYDKVSYANDTLGSELYHFLRWGMLDQALTNLTGTDTALSRRVAAGEGLTDFLYGFRDKTFFEAATGPSGTISADIFSAMSSLFKNVVRGEVDYLNYDVNRVARNVASYDKAFKYWFARRYGEITSARTGNVTMEGVDKSEALLAYFGIPMAENELLWTALELKKEDDVYIDRIWKDFLNPLVQLHKRQIEDGDYDAASDTYQDMGVWLNMPSTQRGKDKLWHNYTKWSDDTPMKVAVEHFFETGKYQVGEIMRRYWNGDAESNTTE